MYRLYIFFLSLFLLQFGSAATTDTLHIFSVSMQKEVPALVISPDTAPKSDRSPVVYLLHGYSGNYLDWSKHVDLGKFSDRYQTYIVCPDGDFNSWYLDSPIQKDSQYETHIVDELIPTIDSMYYTNADKESRAITGLSMGGHGALYLAIRHNSLFCAAGSMSGAVDLTGFPDKWEIAKKLGAYETYPERWYRHSVVNMVSQIKPGSLAIRIDCGINDIFIDNNRHLHEQLLKIPIPHTYVERPGKHRWDYWINALPYQMMFFKDLFKR